MNLFNDLPTGLGAAFMQNPKATQYFSGLSEAEQKEVIHRAQQMCSQEEIQQYVEGLVK